MRFLKPIPGREYLLNLLSYEPETGVLRWKERPLEMFRGQGGIRIRAHLSWNTKYAGQEAFTAIFNGYRTGSIDGDVLQAHRVIWKMVHDAEPENVDLKNGNRSDNRLLNLRGTNPLGNARNAARRNDNRSGITGVCFKSREQKWQAYINVDGKPRTIGTYFTFEEAIAARMLASEAHGYHPNHGRPPIINQRLANANRLREKEIDA